MRPWTRDSGVDVSVYAESAIMHYRDRAHWPTAHRLGLGLGLGLELGLGLARGLDLIWHPLCQKWSKLVCDWSKICWVSNTVLSRPHHSAHAGVRARTRVRAGARAGDLSRQRICWVRDHAHLPTMHTLGLGLGLWLGLGLELGLGHGARVRARAWAIGLHKYCTIETTPSSHNDDKP